MDPNVAKSLVMLSGHEDADQQTPARATAPNGPQPNVEIAETPPATRVSRGRPPQSQPQLQQQQQPQPQRNTTPSPDSSEEEAPPPQRTVRTGPQPPSARGESPLPLAPHCP